MWLSQFGNIKNIRGLIEADGYISSTKWRDLEVTLTIGQGSEFTLSKVNRNNAKATEE